MDQIIRREPQHSPDHPEGKILRCAFTGYRPEKLPFGYFEEDLRCVTFKHRIGCMTEALIRQGFSHFLSGGAQGVDTFAAEVVMSLRRKYDWVTLEIAIPFDGQPDRWDSYSQDRYRWICLQADILTWVSHEYSADCMKKRNQYLVDHCDLLVAAYDGKPGGTARTVAYANKQSRRVRIISPIESERWGA